MKQKGSFTVEAAFVVPLLFLVVWIVIHMGFFMYNREACTAIASLAVLKGSQMEQEGRRTIEKVITAYVKEETEQKLIFTDAVCWDIGISSTNIKVTIQISQRIPFQTLTYEVSEKMGRIHPVSAIWEMERLENIK
nr:pilus assembly protein [Lachnospiraceae bacterium]